MGSLGFSALGRGRCRSPLYGLSPLLVLTSSSRKYCRLVSGLASMVNAIEEEPQAGAFGPIQLLL